MGVGTGPMPFPGFSFPSSGASPMPGAASPQAVSPAMLGLQTAMQEAPGAGYLGSTMEGLDATVGRRTPPAAMRILSQMLKVY